VRNNVPGGESVGEFASAGVERAGGAKGETLIESLRDEIAKLEQVPVSLAFPPAPGQAATLGPACSLLSPKPSSSLREPANSNPSPWGLPPGPSPSRGRESSPLERLEAVGLHEIKPAAYSDAPAALSFALAFLGTRCAERRGKPSPLFWCLTANAAREWGKPYGPGLLSLGIDPSLLLIVEARNGIDAAWALEEGLKASAFMAALGEIEITSPLIARRLGVAAQAGRTPCLLLSGHRGFGLPGTLTRWRIQAALSKQAAFDRRAPGRPAWHLTLERCRGIAEMRNWTVEFCDDAYGVRLVAALADRAAEAGEEKRALSG
jgi:protein ImuA